MPSMPATVPSRPICWNSGSVITAFFWFRGQLAIDTILLQSYMSPSPFTHELGDDGDGTAGGGDGGWGSDGDGDGGGGHDVVMVVVAGSPKS